MIKRLLLCVFVMALFCIQNVKADELTSRALILDAGANIRSGPGVNYKRLGSLGKYSYYNLVTDETFKDENNNDGCSKDWYKIYHNGYNPVYVCGEHVEVVYSYNNDNVSPKSECEKNMANLGFPSTYWGGLCRLKEKYPNWQFVALNTNTEWVDAIEGESSCGWNLIYKSNTGFVDETCKAYDSGYVAILPSGIAYYMDPRNFLSERYIFQFLLLSYDENFKDIYVSGVDSILKGAEFYKYHLGLENNLSNIISLAGNELNVSPIFISARMLQELGSSTTLYNLYSGVYEGNDNEYYGYYNFYNFGVSDSCVQKNGTTYCGLRYAKNVGWNSVDAAIKGGISQLSKYYLGKNQYTNYLQKFNVVGSDSFPKYSHQYMTNVQAPSSESGTTFMTYEKMNILDSSFIFYIPVFKNMQATIDNSTNGVNNDEVVDDANPSTIPIPTIVTSSNYKYQKGYISGIEIGLSAKELKGNIEAVAGNSTVVVVDKDGNTLKKDILKTGDIVKINNQEKTEELTVVIKGDTSGDGEINALDLLQVQKHILKMNKLKGEYKLAADTSGDDEINALDLLQIQKDILNIKEIEQ